MPLRVFHARCTRALAVVVLAGCAVLPETSAVASPLRGGAHSRDAASPAALMPRIVSDGAHGAMVVWLAQYADHTSLQALHLEEDGAPDPAWPAGGVVVAPAVTPIADLSAIADGGGGAFIAWDTGAAFGGVSLHRISMTGATATWTSVAAPLSSRPDTSVTPGPRKNAEGDWEPAMALDGAGGVFYAYVENTELRGSMLFVQRYAGTGGVTSVWPARLALDRIWYPGGVSASPSVCAGDSDDAYVAWCDYTLHVVRVTAAGTVAAGWPANGIQMDSSATAPTIVPDGAGGAIVGWADTRDPSHERIFAQRVHPDGSLAWNPTGIPVCTLATQYGPNRFGWYGLGDQRRGQLVADGAGGALFTWVDQRGGAAAVLADIDAQRITADGAVAPGWTADGVPVCTAPGAQALPNLAGDAAGGAAVAWLDDRDGAWGLRWQHLDAGGQRSIPVDGTLVSAAASADWMPALASDGGAGALLAWVDASDTAAVLRTAHVVPASAAGTGTPTTLRLATDVSPARVGRTITLTATVQPASASGVVEFYDLGTRCGTVPVSNGVATLTRTMTDVGARTFVATYAGDATYQSSSGYVVQRTIPRIVAPLAVACSQNPTLEDRPLTLTATLAAAATGTVEFHDGATLLGTAPLAGGSASIEWTSSAHPAAMNLTASYAGDTAWAPESGALQEIVYHRYPTTVTIAASANPCTRLDATMSVTVTPPVATGSIVFRADSAVVATVPLVNGMASLAYHSDRFTGRLMSAAYAGDDQYAAGAAQLMETFVGQPSATTLSDDVPTNAGSGPQFELVATVAPATATGSVEFFEGTQALGSAAVQAGRATLPWQLSPTSTGAFSATYSTSHADINALSTTTRLGASTASAFVGSLIQFTARIDPPLSIGSVTFFSDGTFLGTAPVTFGVAALVTDALAAGAHHVSATYASNGILSSSISAPLLETILAPMGAIIRVLAPNDAEVLPVRTPFTIRWDPGGAGAVMRVRVCVARDAAAPVWETVADAVPNTGSYAWPVSGPPTPAGTGALIGIFDDSGHEGSDTSDLPFSIVDAPTPVAITRLDATTSAVGVRVVWAASDPAIAPKLELQRAGAAGGPWGAVTAIVRDEDGARVVDDGAVVPGREYWYRLAGQIAGALATFGPVHATAGGTIELGLGPVRPNPTRGSSTVEFAVPRAAHVRLSIVDVGGRVAAVLVDGDYAPGRYQAQWDGRGDRGDVPGGIYFVRLETAGRTFVRRVAIVR